jgi:hypothetical protein
MIFTIQTNDEVAGLDITNALSLAGIQHTILSKQTDTAAQHHAHLTPETLPTSQAVSNASALEQSDGDTPPAQAQVA